jgi:hypothetical protein
MYTLLKDLDETSQTSDNLSHTEYIEGWPHKKLTEIFNLTTYQPTEEQGEKHKNSDSSTCSFKRNPKASVQRQSDRSS